MRVQLTSARGFSLTELLITAGVLSVLTLLGATVINNVGVGNRLVFSRASNVELANALRLQMARRGTCKDSMVNPPAAYAGGGPIAVDLGVNAGLGATVVRAGTDLRDLDLNVRALTVENFAAAGTTNGGNAVYLGDVMLSTQTRDTFTVNRVQFKPIKIARLAFEVQGANTLISCYASDSYQDKTQQLANVCAQSASPDGVPATWDNGLCIAQDRGAPATCGALGGAWQSGRCKFARSTSVVTKVIPAGTVGSGGGFVIECPPNTTLTGAACTSGLPPQRPVGSIYYWVGGMICGWETGEEYTDHILSAACMQ